MNEKRVRDLMHTLDHFATVNIDDTLHNALSAMRTTLDARNNTNCSQPAKLLVYDNGQLVGFLGLIDILRAIEPQYLRSGSYRGWTVDATWAIPVFWEGLFSDRCLESIHKEVKNYMQPCPFSLHADDPLIKAVYGMSRYNIDMLPVVEDEIIVGVISSTDLFREMCALILPSSSNVTSLEDTRTHTMPQEKRAAR